jgi:hypothetical protein
MIYTIDSDGWSFDFIFRQSQVQFSFSLSCKFASLVLKNIVNKIWFFRIQSIEMLNFYLYYLYSEMFLKDTQIITEEKKCQLYYYFFYKCVTFSECLEAEEKKIFFLLRKRWLILGIFFQLLTSQWNYWAGSIFIVWISLVQLNIKITQ